MIYCIGRDDDKVARVWILKQSQNWHNQKKLNEQPKKLLSPQIGYRVDQCVAAWAPGWLDECMHKCVTVWMCSLIHGRPDASVYGYMYDCLDDA